MSRDRLKDYKYFDEYIDYQNKRIEKFQNVANQIGDSEIQKKQRCLSVIANFKKDLVCAHYSKGTAKADIEKLVKDYLNHIKQIKMESYADYIDAIALGILCDVNLEIFAEEMDNDLADDLIALLLGQESVEKPSLNFETVYLPFYNFLS